MDAAAIQIISTHWTKASRGEPAASQRAAVPLALPLPGMLTGPTQVIYHRVTYRESSGFKPHVVDETVLDTLPERDVGVELHATAEGLSVAYRWERACGAPPRDIMVIGPTLRLRPGQWGRLVHNGRFAWEDTWAYQQIVFNVGALRHSAQFVEELPDKEQRVVRALW